MATRWSSEFYVAQHKDLQATAMAVDCTGAFALLAGKYCLGLKNLNKTSESLIKMSRTNKYKINTAEWNPHPQNKELCALSYDNMVEILNITKGNSLLNTKLSYHTHTVSDLNWNHLDPFLLATCSMDRYTYVWDLRESPKPAIAFSSISSASLVKWNRYCGNVIATAHNGDIRVWDQRKGSAPLHFISPHDSTIYCIDWSRNKRNQLATTGQDCTVKFFNTSSLKQEHVTISSVAPVYRARFMPFSNGMLMSVIPPQKRGDNSLLMWNLSSPSSPVHTFLGHTDIVLDFAWRPCDSEKSKYQLVTWSKDNTLRLWHGETFLETVCSAISEESINYTDESEESQIAIETNTGYMADISCGQDLEVCQAIEADEMMTTADMMLSSDSETDSSPVDIIEPEITIIPDITSILLQEFNSQDLNSINNLSLQTDAKERICIASMDMNNLIIRLNIRFPIDYPNKTSPSFEFSQDTDIDHLIQAKLIKLVKHTASQRVKKNKTCLEECLRQFVSTVQQLLPVGDEDIGSIIKAGGNVLYRQYLNDSFIPFPRMSGANFTNNGLLVCFGRKVWNKLGHSEAVTPRNLTSLAALYSDSPSSVASFYSHQRLGPSTGTFRTQKLMKAAVSIYDASSLSPIRKDLAEKYVFNSEDTVDMCLRNGNIASLIGRYDLEQTWLLASLAAQLSPPKNREIIEDIPWQKHPLSLEMIKSMIEYYVNVGDVQTAAMLCCAFGSKTVVPKYPEHRISSNKSLSPEPDGYGARHAMHLERPIDGFKITNNMRLTRSSSWSDIYEESARVVQHTVTQQSGRLQLDSSLNQMFDTYKLAYADILQSWQLLHTRAQVMKYVSELPSSHKGLDLESKCDICKRPTNKSVCDSCKRPVLICTICRTPVLGLANGCLVCNHGGHTKHLKDWFSRHTICPTGCGCQCMLLLTDIEETS